MTRAYPRNSSRRAFLRTASLASAAGYTAAPFALNLASVGAAAAQSASDYRALVCVFLLGGNDHGNTVLATDEASWQSYNFLRPGNGIGLPAVGESGGVLPINPLTPQTNRSFALHPALAPIKSLFDAGQAAVVANVGPLIEPLSKTDFRNKTGQRPPKLFSHNDQQSIWQAYAPEGARYGWGGRMGDLFASMNAAQTFTCMSTSGNAVWLAGQDTIPYRVSNNGATEISGLSGRLYGSTRASELMHQIVTESSANLFERSYAGVTQRAIDAQVTLNNGMIDADSLPAVPVLPNNGGQNRLAAQLAAVARIIGGRSTLGARRQVFYVSVGGYDFHSQQITNQGNKLAELAQAIEHFQTLLATPEVNAVNETTLFTASDFGRTMASNGDGTDHGWGSHHFVVGGAVNGGDIYGRFPETASDGGDDVGRGRLLPQISVDQYGATLAKWFGVSNSMLADIFPNLGNFGSAQDLGFMA
ncbi:MAG: DUF1501 domain-containing protein [Burkholderiaceae bacterium]